MFFNKKKKDREATLMTQRLEKEEQLEKLMKQMEKLEDKYLVCSSIVYPLTRGIYTDEFLGKVVVTEIKKAKYTLNSILDWFPNNEEQRVIKSIARLKTAIQYFEKVQKQADQDYL